MGHEHGAEALLGGDPAGVECAVDHHAETGSAGRADSAELVASGKPHHHQCVACHFGGQRLLSSGPQGIAVDVGLDPDGSLEATSTPRVARDWTGRTLRGPPAA